MRASLQSELLTSDSEPPQLPAWLFQVVFWSTALVRCSSVVEFVQEYECSRSALNTAPNTCLPRHWSVPKSKMDRYTMFCGVLMNPTLACSERSSLQYDWFGNVLLIIVQCHRPADTDGSTYSGSWPEDSRSGSGVTTRSVPDTRTPIGARRAALPGWFASLVGLSPRAGSGWASTVESHAIGAPIRNTGLPAASTTAAVPGAAPSLTAGQVPDVRNRSWASRGSRAASRVLTTSTSEKPVRSARTRRSTPGSTSAYVAVSPDSVGAGSAPGQDSPKRFPWYDSVASGPAPPHDSASGTADTAGASRVSACACDNRPAGISIATAGPIARPIARAATRAVRRYGYGCMTPP